MSLTASEAAGPALSAPLRTALTQRIRADELDLPVLPEVASQVIQLSFDTSCDIRRLTALIQRDQSMAAHVLRLANSALYCPSSAIVSLQQALARLGMNKIREIALMISCETKVFRVDGFDLRVRGMFRHAIAAGTYAQEVARLRRWNVEEAFLCGLLSDVGRPVLLQALVDLKKSLGADAAREAMEATADEFHCAIGAELVRRWKLPARLAETILHHHDPGGAESAAQTAMMSRLANDLGHYAAGPKAMAAERLRVHPLLAPLNIYPEEMERLLDMRDKVLAVVEQIG